MVHLALLGVHVLVLLLLQHLHLPLLLHDLDELVVVLLPLCGLLHILLVLGPLVGVIVVPEAVAVDLPDSLLELEDLDLLEGLVVEDPVGAKVHLLPDLLGLLKQLNAVDVHVQLLLGEDHVLDGVVLVDLGEAPAHLLGQELGADVSEVVDQRLGGRTHRLALEGAEGTEVLDLALVQRQGHPHQNLSHRVETHGDVLVVAVLSDEVGDDLLDDWPDGLGGDEVVAALDDHGKDLADLVLVVGGEVAEEVGVELEELDLVPADHPRDQPQHVQFNLVLVV
mmetsp:Transcript_16553/g.28153  ORF Transcript_16553/g.28153 Transcript_16553/m.28153 type:complete len:281 (-) Transcript_16553:1057-1899(-)